MTKLNHDLRKKAVRNLEAEVRQGQQKARRPEQARLARAVYNKIVPGPRLALLRRVPAEFLLWQSHLQIEVGDKRLRLELPESRPVPTAFSRYGHVDPVQHLGLTLPDRLREKLIYHAERVQRDEEVRRQLCEEARVVLNTCRTMKQLREVWPTAERLFPSVTEPAAFPLAVRADELDQKIEEAKR